MEREEIRYSPLPTQRAFIDSDAVVNVIYSNTGEGKTFACIGAILKHAARCGRPIRCAIVRDTLENLKNSVVVSIKEFFQDYPWAYKFTDQDKKLRISAQDENGARLDITADLFGIDDLGSLSRLQGPEYALIWLNEPAPMAERVNAGLSEEVFNAALVRCARQKGTKARLQVDMNPADEDHWTFKRFLEEDSVDPENPLITKAVFRVPYGENIHANEVSRQAVKAAYKNDPASYARYVEGQFAVIEKGEKVTPYYRRIIHLLPYAADPVRGLESFRLWDSWGSPCCILGQMTMIGRMIIYNVCLIDGNSDLRTLISTQVEPLLNSPRWKGKARSWRDIGDFTMGQRDQSNVEESAKLVVQKAFKGRFESGPSTWKLIKQALDDMFQRNGLIQGMPSVQLDPVGAKLLDRALGGRWHYPVDNQGKRSREKPVKDTWSHVGDAFANGCAVLRPSSRKADMVAARQLALKTKKRAQSYAVAGGTM
jgi:hypothetical protein